MWHAIFCLFAFLAVSDVLPSCFSGCQSVFDVLTTAVSKIFVFTVIFGTFFRVYIFKVFFAVFFGSGDNFL